MTSEDQVDYQIWFPEQNPSNKNQTYLQKFSTFKVFFEISLYTAVGMRPAFPKFVLPALLNRCHEVRPRMALRTLGSTGFRAVSL